MKFVIYNILIFSVVGIVPANAQSIKSYLAVIRTSDHIKHKGILQRVDSNKVIIHSDRGFKVIPSQSIETIKIRLSKKRYKGKDFVPIVDEDSRYKLNNEGKYVDEWGKEQSSTAVIDDVIASSVGNVLINSVALSIHQINPGLSVFKINCDQTSYLNQIDELSYYSIYYQRNPNLSDELDKLKKISSEFKQE